MSIENKLRKYLFPVAERKVFVGDINKGELKKTSDYKGIYRTDKNKLISIMKVSYKVVPNSQVILPLMEELSKLDTRYYIDDSHSFVEDAKMRLQITFPELRLNDGQSDLAISLYISNSLDGSESVRILFGLLRFVCSNGLIIGHVLSKFYHKHTSGLQLKNITEQIKQSYDMIPAIKERINTLKQLKVSDSILSVVEEDLGKTISKYVKDNMPVQNHWALYCLITYYISHYLAQKYRANYQIKASSLFSL